MSIVTIIETINSINTHTSVVKDMPAVVATQIVDAAVAAFDIIGMEAVLEGVDMDSDISVGETLNTTDTCDTWQ